MKTEPVMIGGFLTSVLALIATFGVKLTGEQIQLIVQIVTPLLTLAIAWYVRRFTYSGATVEKLLAEANNQKEGN